MQQPGEPSVEEILDSIKKVIARDNREGAIAQRRERGRAAMASEPTEPIEPADADEAEEVLELDEEAMVQHSDPDRTEHDSDMENDHTQEPAPLTNDAIAKSMQANFAALAMLAEPGAQPQVVRSGETSLEGLVREMLRPMLAGWLDANLPEMVEKLVKDEISRIAGKRG